ncbi:MAG: hypothetical protein ABSG65_23620 [Bryobacteraceae bacterium]|jgi:hypothetical protein
MRKITIMFALALALATVFSGATKRDFQTGKLLDVTTAANLVRGTSHERAIFVVQVGDLIYTAKGDRLGRVHDSPLTLAVTGPGDDGRELIVGDPVDVSISGDELIIRKPTGKELKTKIIKRVRAQ